MSPAEHMGRAVMLLTWAAACELRAAYIGGDGGRYKRSAARLRAGAKRLRVWAKGHTDAAFPSALDLGLYAAELRAVATWRAAR